MTDDAPPEPTANEFAPTPSQPGATNLAIDAPETSRPDEPIEIRITGAPPGEPVEFEAAIEDRDGVEWRSTATFEADEAGVVDLTRHAPESGSYEGVEPMGWLWSMAAGEDQVVTALATPEPTTVTLRARSGGRRAERTITRDVGDEPITRADVGRDDLAGAVYEPDEPGPHPGVLVLHGSGGTTPEFEAALLAAHGFAAFAVRYFGADDAVPDELDRIPLSYFDRAAEWFLDRPDVAGGRLGLVGFSRGGEVGLLLGARRGWVGAVVSYVGSGILWDTPSGAPAWAADGEPLPYVSGEGAPTLREGQLDAADAATRRAATIPVEETDGPILLISGAEDPIWPGRRLLTIAADRLRRHEFDHEFAHLSYDDAGHFITPPYLPKTDPVFGGTAAGMAHADADAWPRVLEYLRTGLEPDESPP